MNSNSVALVSGGLDSVTMLYHVVKDLRLKPRILLVDYGQKQLYKEECFTELHAHRLGLSMTEMHVQLPEPESHDNGYAWYVPARNAILLSLAASVAESFKIHEVYTGFHGYEGAVWDGTDHFVKAMNAVMKLNPDFDVSFYAPLYRYSKKDLILLGRHYGIDYAETWSCFEAGDKACGTCPICIARLKAFASAGIEDPLGYVVRQTVS